MRLQEFITKSAKDSIAEAFKYAKAVPEDKLDWSPEGARSVISMARELAMTPTWTLMAFGEQESDWSEEAMADQQKLMDSWKTVDECQAQFEERWPAVEKFFLEMTDEDFKKTKWLPYNGGRDHTYLEMTDYPRWNGNWHAGQIAYVQTMYGDKEMY